MSNPTYIFILTTTCIDESDNSIFKVIGVHSTLEGARKAAICSIEVYGYTEAHEGVTFNTYETMIGKHLDEWIQVSTIERNPLYK